MHNKKMSFPKILLIFYIVIASGFTKNLYSKQLKSYVKENRLAQHFIGYIMMLVLITLMSKISDLGTILSYSMIAYGWFIITTKMDIHWNIMTIMMLLCIYLYELQTRTRTKRIKKDVNLDDQLKNDLTYRYDECLSVGNKMIILFSLIGLSLYFYKKRAQYGNPQSSNIYGIQNGGTMFDPVKFFIQ